MQEFCRMQMLVGEQALQKLNNSHVAVFGIGGVGCHAVEALARAGVGKITLVDDDVFASSNVNRQLYALQSTIGQRKVDVARDRIADINPNCQVDARCVRFDAQTANQFDFSQFHYVVDAIDTVTSKLLLVKLCNDVGTPIISCMGTGNKLDPTKFQIADISQTSVCPLARIMRKECRKRGIQKLKVLYSTEDPIPSDPEAISLEELPEGRRALPGSVAFVPSVAGLIIAGEVIKDLIK